MVDGVNVRQATADERKRLEDLQRRASLALDEYNEQLEAHPDAINLASEWIIKGDVLVAEIDDDIVGFAATFRNGSAVELDGLFVDPEHWRRGIGTALIDAVVQEARERGVSLVTVIANPTARAFYERCGFAVGGMTDTRFGIALQMSRQEVRFSSTDDSRDAT